MNGINLQKANLRALLKERRASRSYDPELAEALCVHLAELCLGNGATKVAAYLAFGDEPDTEIFIDWAIENDIEVMLPVAQKDGSLTWVMFEGETESGIFGFQEPVGRSSDLAEADLIIVPALAIDGSDARLGKGKGYYDKALGAQVSNAPVIAVVFEDELLEKVPTEDHDRSVDAVVTPSGITRFSERLN